MAMYEQGLMNLLKPIISKSTSTGDIQSQAPTEGLDLGSLLMMLLFSGALGKKQGLPGTEAIMPDYGQQQPGLAGGNQTPSFMGGGQQTPDFIRMLLSGFNAPKPFGG